MKNLPMAIAIFMAGAFIGIGLIVHSSIFYRESRDSIKAETLEQKRISIDGTTHDVDRSNPKLVATSMIEAVFSGWHDRALELYLDNERLSNDEKDQCREFLCWLHVASKKKRLKITSATVHDYGGGYMGAKFMIADKYGKVYTNELNLVSKEGKWYAAFPRWDVFKEL